MWPSAEGLPRRHAARQAARDARAPCLERIRAAAASTRRPLAGGSGPTLAAVYEALARTRLCTECLGRQLNASRVEVLDALQSIARTLVFRTDIGRCERCLSEKVVHRIG
jgi:hypothetical protein